jgi:hypothetical protein
MEKYIIKEIDEVYQILESLKNDFIVKDSFEKFEEKPTLFFRGQNNASWDIRPSINHGKYNEDERERYLSFLKTRDNRFKGLSKPQKIAAIQHYACKNKGTRCIDFTIDINIALYFACEGNEKKDGALFICSYTPHKESWYTSLMLTELAFYEKKGEILLSEFCNDIRNLYSLNEEFTRTKRDINEIELEASTILPYGCMVCYNPISFIKNRRMERQKGCMYICGSEFLNKKGPTYLTEAPFLRFFPHKVIEPSLIFRHSAIKIEIPSTMKKSILKFLSSQRGINKEYLFPD